MLKARKRELEKTEHFPIHHQFEVGIGLHFLGWQFEIYWRKDAATDHS